jgi:hypothetical protein
MYSPRLSRWIAAVLCAACSSPSTTTDAGDERPAPSDLVAMDAVPDDAPAMDRGDVAPVPTDGGPATDATDADGPPVGLDRRCSAARPCPSGLACVDGTCQLDCGGDARCGSPARCCASGEVCAAGVCAAPGAPCTPTPGCGTTTGTCPSGQYCDGTLLRCLPNTATTMCTVPAARSFRPVESWSWTGSRAYPGYRGVLATPIVADVNRDGASDVLVVAYRDPPASFGGNIAPQAILCALSGPGDCMGAPRELWCSEPQANATRDLNAWGNIAVADLDATDGRDALTIIAQMRLGSTGSGGIVAFDERGTRLWEGRRMDGTAVNTDTGVTLGSFGSVAIADLEGDGRSEIIVGNTVFESTGVLRWQDPTPCTGTFGGHSFAADLSDPPDGRLEVICGGTAYTATGARFWDGGARPNGWGGLADFDGDGRPEIVVINAGSITLLRADGTPASAPTSFASIGLNGNGGAPTIADLDGDLVPEIGVAGGSVYGALRVIPVGRLFRFERAWVVPADDASSSSTGSAMFDFDGDGQYEVIYQDTCRARVFSGRDGAVLMDIPNISGTAANYPTVADLNGDGRAEFITVSDSYYARAGIIPCPASTPRTDGVRVFRDANDNWQSTRAVWNQFSYAVTNVCDGVDAVCVPAENRHGAIPRRPRPSWTGGINSFRVNAQLGLVARRATDLVVLGLSADVSACPAAYTLRADVANRGALSAPAGTPVSFYLRGAMGVRTLLGTVNLPRALAPGGTARVELRVTPAAAGVFEVIAVVNDDGMGPGALRECNGDNNTSAPLTVDCTLIG